MKIQYLGGGPVISRDIVGEEYALWQPGEIKSITPGQKLRVRLREFGSEGEPIVHFEEQDAANVIFASGPSWVDAESGKNPLFVCVTCGDTTTAETFHPNASVAYRDTHGDRLCVRCFLRANPQYTEYHQRRGFDVAELDEQPAETGSALAIISPEGEHTVVPDPPAHDDDAE